ncbi:MAG: Na+/H+ antiporter subunit E [Candidatus Competibacteraceae bacterium]|mgnify:CR=1 FL=1
MNKLLTALALALRFPVEVARSGWATARLILTGGANLQPGFARMSCAGLSDTGAVVLGLLITLTPGTTTVDIDPQRGELLLHLLDTRDVEDALAAIQRDFVRPVSLLFGKWP